MRNFLTAFARNSVFANVLLALIFLSGGMAILNLVRETFPEMSTDMVTVTVPWPGADPEEVEEGICRKIEEAIEGIEGIKKYETQAQENFGMASIEVLADYDVDFVKERVRNAVDSISTFPLDAERAVTERSIFRSPVIGLALSGKGLQERELKEWTESIKEELLQLREVSQVQVMGTRDYEIGIEVSEARLQEYGITFSQVAQAVRASSLNLSGGTMRTVGEQIRLRTIGRKYTAREFAEIVVLARPNGDVVRLDRIATIKDGFAEDMVISRFNREPTNTLMVLKTATEDTLAIDRAVRQYVARKRMELPEGVHITVWMRLADILESRINLLVRNGLIGLVLVFAVLWLFLDARLSFWVGMGMPISIMGALAIMWGLGATINMVSLFALIMVVGIVVDDAIVVGEAIFVARKAGAPPLKAAVDGLMEVGIPVIAAVTTSIVAFMPMFFIGGSMGKVIVVLPMVVIACLSISLVECLVLLPAHLTHLPDPNNRREAKNPIRRALRRFHEWTSRFPDWFVQRFYEPFVTVLLQWRYTSLGVAVLITLSMLGLWESGMLKFEFFPELDGSGLVATVEFPSGTPLGVTEGAVIRMEDAFQRLADRTETASGAPLLRNVFSIAGASMQFSRQGVGSSSGTHVGSVRVDMLDSAERGVHSSDLMAAWEEEIGAIPGVVSLTLQGEEAGPGGIPIDVWLQGHDMERILLAAEEVKAKLATYQGVYQIQHDYRPGKNELKLRLKPEARALGLTVSDLARQVHAGYFGEEAIRLQRGRDDIRVRVRYPAEERNQMAFFERVRIRTPQGHEVPLFSVADVAFGPGPSVIRRTDGMRRVSVTAEVNAGVANAGEILDAMSASFLPELLKRYPDLKVSLEGEQRDRADTFGPLYVSYPIALLAIFIIIATIFRSYLQPLVIMATIPFGLIGAVLGHLLLGYKVSAMSMFGMVALTGVVVNDGIVLIECINSYIAKGVPLYEAVRRGGARRFRAIFLTTISTVGGLTPLLLERDMQARFLIPMAISMAAGVAFATVLTLLFVPSLLCILNDFRRITRWMIKGVWPSPEEVEPAYQRNDEIADGDTVISQE